MKLFLRAVARLLIFCLVLGLFGCGETPVSKPRPSAPVVTAPLPTESTPVPTETTPTPTATVPAIATQNQYLQENTQLSLSGQATGRVQLSQAGGEEIATLLAAYAPDFPSAAQYGTADVLDTLQFSAAVSTHAYDVGEVTVSALMAAVEENNRQYLAGKPFGYEDVDSGKLRQVCTIITDATNEMLSRYPDLDENRIRCNLGALKILNKPGMLSNALVSKDLVLAISPNSESIVTNLQGEDAYQRVLTHEVMHILQMGCPCEDIPGCDRRAGISLSIPDHPLGTTDILWLVEASAEQNMCDLLRCQPTTYQTKLAYLHGCTMAILPNPEMQPDTLQTICFYDDPQRLFDAFGCEDAPRQEALLTMLLNIQLLDAPPKQFAQATGLDVTGDAFYYDSMHALGMALSQEFYENLALLLQAQPVTTEDLCFLVSLFEARLNSILHYAVSRHAPYYTEFLASYVQLRSGFFQAVDSENGTALADAYAQYVLLPQTGAVNATLSGFSPEKQAYLLEQVLQIGTNSGLARIVG